MVFHVAEKAMTSQPTGSDNLEVKVQGQTKVLLTAESKPKAKPKAMKRRLTVTTTWKDWWDKFYTKVIYLQQNKLLYTFN